MSLIQAIVNEPYDNRIQLILLGGMRGPLVSDELGEFDPRRDLTVYNDGRLISVTSYVFDAPNNRYLLFTREKLNKTGVVQVVHHTRTSLFHDASIEDLLHHFVVVAGQGISGSPYTMTLTAQDINGVTLTDGFTPSSTRLSVYDQTSTQHTISDLLWEDGVGTLTLGAMDPGDYTLTFQLDGKAVSTRPTPVTVHVISLVSSLEIAPVYASSMSTYSSVYQNPSAVIPAHDTNFKIFSLF